MFSPMPVPIVRSLLCQQVHGSSYGTAQDVLPCWLISFSPTYMLRFTWKMNVKRNDNSASILNHIQDFLPSRLALLCEFIRSPSCRYCPDFNAAVSEIFQCHVCSSVHCNLGSHFDVVSWLRVHRIQSLDCGGNYPHKV